MNAQQLRNSILQEAIQGRLVPHDANEEPASLLLQRIKNEKERLVKIGKLKKRDLEINPIKEEEIPFEIPNNWKWVRFKDIALLITDGTHSTPKYKETGVPFISVKNMSNGKLSFENCKYISKEEHIELCKRCCPKKGDLLLSKVGTTGVPAIVDVDVEFSIFVSIALIKFLPSEINPQFLVHLINSPLVQEQAKENTRGVGNKNWVINDIANTLLVIPPLAEQRRIVAKIEQLLPLVEKYGQAQIQHDLLQAELPSKLRQSILQEAIQGRLIPQDPNDEPASALLKRIIKEKEQLVQDKVLKAKDAAVTPLQSEEVSCIIPQGWVFVHLKDVCLLSDGEKKTGSHICMDAKYLRGKKAGDLLTSGKFVKKGDNIILVDGENSGEVFTAPIDGYMGSTFKKLWVSSELYLPYILYIIRSYKEALRNSKRGAAIPHLNKDIFYNIEVGIPPFAEQKRIVTKIEELFSIIKA